MNERSLGSRVAAVLVAVALVAAAATPAMANPRYDDTDSEPLKVGYMLLYPVGKLIELVVFRPIHAVASVTMPNPDDPRGDDGIRRCSGFRPRRDCSRGR